MSNLILNKIKDLDYQDLAWMYAEVENLVIAKNEAYKKLFKNNRNFYGIHKCKALQGKLENLIDPFKQRHYERLTQ